MDSVFDVARFVFCLLVLQNRRVKVNNSNLGKLMTGPHKPKPFDSAPQSSVVRRRTIPATYMNAANAAGRMILMF